MLQEQKMGLTAFLCKKGAQVARYLPDREGPSLTENKFYRTSELLNNTFSVDNFALLLEVSIITDPLKCFEISTMKITCNKAEG